YLGSWSLGNGQEQSLGFGSLSLGFRFTYLAPGLLSLTFDGFGFDLWARMVPGFGFFDKLSFNVKYKYETRNKGNGPKNKENTDSYETFRHNPYDSVTRLSHPSQHYGVTWTLAYAVTSFKLARWKVRVSSLRHKPLKEGDQGLHSSKNSTRSPKEITLLLLLYLIVHNPLLSWFRWISFDYHAPLGFGSIAGGLISRGRKLLDLLGASRASEVFQDFQDLPRASNTFQGLSRHSKTF
nr:hypothetical protein [Tanacetum cinerariifolium]